MKRRLFPLFMICALLLMGASLFEVAFAGGKGINLKGLDGQKYDTEKMRGQVVLVSFGATWCEPCHYELGALEELNREYKGRPVQFWWVSVDDKDQASDDDLREFGKTMQMSFPIMRDAKKEHFKKFSERVRLPMVVIFEREGKMVEPLHFGMSSQRNVYKRMMRERINKLLTE